MLNFLNGKKTFIGLFALAFYNAGALLGWYTADATVQAAILAWTGVGLAHKAYKA